MSPVVPTALNGLMVAPGHLHPVLGFAALLCIAIGAGAAGALNMWFDADVDAVMSRTARRPIPAGRVLRREALAFGMTLAFGAVAVLGLVANWLAASLLAFTIFFYVAIYTHAALGATPQNIVIGGAAGAFPPVIGWAAATGTVGFESVLLFLIISSCGPRPTSGRCLCGARKITRWPEFRCCRWTPAMRRRGGRSCSIRWCWRRSACRPGCSTACGCHLAVPTAIVAGALMVWLAVKIKVLGDGAEGDRAAKRLFGVSILYLFALFAVLLIADDRLRGRSSAAACCVERLTAWTTTTASRASCSPPCRCAAVARGRSPSRSRSARWCCCSTSSTSSSSAPACCGDRCVRT